MARLAAVVWFALVAWPAWIRGGTTVFSQTPLPVLAATLAVLACSRSTIGKRILCDPLLYLSLAFITLLWVQWWNAGRVLFFDPLQEIWRYSDPQRAGWPSAFTRAEAAEMIRWFMPAAVMALVIRARTWTPTQIRRCWRGLTINAALIGLGGIVQRAVGYHFFPYTRDIDVQIFASFGYPNHAASFFALTTALAAGLWVHDVLDTQPRRIGRVIGSSVVLIINFAATQLTLSRAGILMGWLLLGLGGGWVLARAWKQLSPANRVNWAAATVAVMLSLAMLVGAYGFEDIRHELSTLRDRETGSVVDGFAEAAGGNRILLVQAAVQIWREAPWVGVGGWGYRYLLPYTQPEDGWGWTREDGRANVHNDFLQFLAEFGIIGTGLLLAGLGVMLRPLWQRDQEGQLVLLADPLPAFACIGCALVLLHSQIDLPFRSPAILLTWISALAGAGRLNIQQRTSSSELPTLNYEKGIG